jgi:multidrug efflux pump subunit AcrA (membrane-fusion protein)
MTRAVSAVSAPGTMTRAGSPTEMRVMAATGTAIVRLGLGSATRLTPGTPVQVEIQTEEHKDVVIVPALAIVRDEDKTYVYVVGADQKAHRKPVVLGIVAGEDAEVRSGVNASDKVIVKGHEELPDGAAVTVMQK